MFMAGMVQERLVGTMEGILDQSGLCYYAWMAVIDDGGWFLYLSSSKLKENLTELNIIVRTTGFTIIIGFYRTKTYWAKGWLILY